MCLMLSLSLISCGGGDSGDNVVVDDSETTPTEDVVKPNILLVIADDLGLDASSQYSVSNDRPNTPILDALGASGLIFDNAWATPACTTTRGSLITGLHGVNSGVDTVPNLMDTSLNTLQRYLSSATDYQSAVIGKWHLAGRDVEVNHPGDSGVSYYAGNITGTLTDYYSWPMVMNGVESISNEYHTTAVTNMAIDWIDEQADPWFLWLAYVAPHSPFHLPPDNLHTRDLSGSDEDIDANQREYYLAAIEAMDTELGRLLDSLSEAERDNTLIVFIGDNGTPRAVVDTSVFVRNQVKGTLYEGGIRIPMTVSGAGVTRIGEREAALVNTTDIYPTIGQAAGAGAAVDIDGVSFYTLLSDQLAETRSYNYSEFVSNAVTGWAVRNDEYKLIEFADGTRELYYMTTDLREENNLINEGTTGYVDIITELAGYAMDIRAEAATAE